MPGIVYLSFSEIGLELQYFEHSFSTERLMWLLWNELKCNIPHSFYLTTFQKLRAELS